PGRRGVVLRQSHWHAVLIVGGKYGEVLERRNCCVVLSVGEHPAAKQHITRDRQTISINTTGRGNSAIYHVLQLLAEGSRLRRWSHSGNLHYLAALERTRASPGRRKGSGGIHQAILHAVDGAVAVHIPLENDLSIGDQSQ